MVCPAKHAQSPVSVAKQLGMDYASLGVITTSWGYGMVWMEMRRLRTTEGQSEAALGLLRYSVSNVAKEPGLVQIHVYNSASFHNDLALSLVWDTHIPHRQGSRTGLSISETLNAFGLVEHSIWVEKEARQAELI